MKIKCIDNIGFEHCLVCGRIYELIDIKCEGIYKRVIIIDETGSKTEYPINRFVTVTEKPVILEGYSKKDLDGLSNHHGLYSFYNKEDNNIQVYSDNELKMETNDLDLLKRTGFNFIIKKKRTFEEIIAELDVEPYKEFEENYYLHRNNKGVYFCLSIRSSCILERTYRKRDQLEKAVEELNS